MWKRIVIMSLSCNRTALHRYSNAQAAYLLLEDDALEQTRQEKEAKFLKFILNIETTKINHGTVRRAPASGRQFSHLVSLVRVGKSSVSWRISVKRRRMQEAKINNEVLEEQRNLYRLCGRGRSIF